MEWRGMHISNSDLTLLAFLEGIEAHAEVPDGCDIDAILSQKLVICEGTRCGLTQAGRDRLRNLKTVLHGDYRFTW
jgi:hypothetical protein